MHTKGTDVKGRLDRRVAQGDATRASLVKAARELFGEKGYVDTSIDEIVARAGVTKGAVYHHFEGKEGLFRAVFEQVHTEVTDQAAAEFLGPDSWAALLDGCALWIDAHLDPAIRTIALQDARAVLGWDEVRGIENRFGAVALRGALRKAMHAGVLEQRPLRPLALLLMGALGEGCLYIAESNDPVEARTEVLALITDMLSAFRITQEAADAPERV
ncbi:MAG TPA: helix-turn-helix domain-containing protein [Acidimicrobiales bacterium]|jgi:AcrR family transcriptional regulator|nr:helix-turn-helix domain-containing protein [Acidimicrobiales bacterium]